MPQTIVIASTMRETGTSGMQTHFRTFHKALQNQARACELITPYDRPRWQVYPVFGARRVVDRVNGAASVWWYRYWHEYFLCRALRPVLRKHEQCVIYAQCPSSAWAALQARRSPEQRVVMVVHFNISQADEWAGKGLIEDGGRLFRRIRRFEEDIVSRVDGIVFVSRFMREQLIHRIPSVAGMPHVVIPNFLSDPGRANGEAPTRDLINIGTLEPRKNQAYLIEIIAAALALGTPLSLTLAGNGPDRALLEDKARRLGVDHLVRFAGYVPNAAQLINQHRAYIHTATLENLPMTLIEAMSRGRAVFAPGVGGIPELFEDGVEGRILPLDDAREAARRVLEWTDQPDRIAEAGSAARRRFLENYEDTATARRLTDFLDGLGRAAARTKYNGRPSWPAGADAVP